MNYNKLMIIVTSMIAFSTFLGVLAAIIFYLFQIKETQIAEAVLWGIIYPENQRFSVSQTFKNRKSL